MADYAIGLSFHKAHRTIVRAIGLNAPCRYYATRSQAGMITLPTLDTGNSYVEIQGVTQADFSISDNNQDFRLLGDEGWNDSVITGSSVQASCTAYFLKDAEIPAGGQCPQFRGNYDEGFALIERARYDKEFEIYIEFLKELGQADGATGNYIYDFTGFNACIGNYSESLNAEGLTEVSFELMSRGKPVFGRYDNGSSQIVFGGVNSNLLFLESGVRQVAVVPADNASAISVSANLSVTFTSNGTAALTQLALGQTDGSGFELTNASTGAKVSATVTQGTGGSANVFTINPDASLASGTIFMLNVLDGAVTQAVDANGAASSTGVEKPIQGSKVTFRTA